MCTMLGVQTAAVRIGCELVFDEEAPTHQASLLLNFLVISEI